MTTDESARAHHAIDDIEIAVTEVDAKAFYGKALGCSFVDYGPDVEYSAAAERSAGCAATLRSDEAPLRYLRTGPRPRRDVLKVLLRADVGGSAPSRRPHSQETGGVRRQRVTRLGVSAAAA